MEMLIVIAIVAVLISIAIPVLSSQLERSSGPGAGKYLCDPV